MYYLKLADLTQASAVISNAASMMSKTDVPGHHGIHGSRELCGCEPSYSGLFSAALVLGIVSMLLLHQGAVSKKAKKHTLLTCWVLSCFVEKRWSQFLSLT